MTPAQAFFSMFSYPLTPFEQWKYQWQGQASDSAKSGEDFFGEDFLADPLWALRTRRWRISIAKLRKAVRAAKVLRYAPFVRGVAVGNTLAYYNARPFADIDMFILYEGEHGWAVRFACALSSLLFGRPGVRKKDRTTRSPLCFSFFLGADRLNISFLRAHDPDVYLAYWVAHLFPLYGGEIWERMWDENQEWVAPLLPNTYPRHTVSSFSVSEPAGFGLTVKNLLELFFSRKIVSSLLAHVEWAWLPVELKQRANKDTRVVIGPRILKFHRTDKREYYRTQWKSLIEDSS